MSSIILEMDGIGVAFFLAPGGEALGRVFQLSIIALLMVWS